MSLFDKAKETYIKEQNDIKISKLKVVKLRNFIKHRFILDSQESILELMDGKEIYTQDINNINISGVLIKQYLYRLINRRIMSDKEINKIYEIIILDIYNILDTANNYETLKFKCFMEIILPLEEVESMSIEEEIYETTQNIKRLLDKINISYKNYTAE